MLFELKFAKKYMFSRFLSLRKLDSCFFYVCKKLNPYFLIFFSLIKTLSTYRHENLRNIFTWHTEKNILLSTYVLYIKNGIFDEIWDPVFDSHGNPRFGRRRSILWYAKQDSETTTLLAAARCCVLCHNNACGLDVWLSSSVYINLGLNLFHSYF